MRELFLKLKEEGKTLLFASHNREDIEVLCDEVYEMDKGRLQKISGWKTRDNLKKLSIGYVILVFGFVFGLQSNPYLIYGLLPKVKMLGMIGEAAYDFFVAIFAFI